MNYRHIFHAGNIPDVVKHAVLTLVLQHLRAKEKPFAVIDTHAGIGRYDLEDARALKTLEADAGIKRLLSSPALASLAPLYDVLEKLNPGWERESSEGFRIYPGSPILTYHMTREQDRIVACELHPEDAETLRYNAPADKRIQVHCRDGYEALGAFLPPPEKRGLVLIDPPYEQPDEFATLFEEVKQAYTRWPTGIYMLWYPIKERPAVWRFHEALATSGIPKILCAEFIFQEEVRADRLNGSGLIIINPPWKIETELQDLFLNLHRSLDTAYAGTSIKWLAD